MSLLLAGGVNIPLIRKSFKEHDSFYLYAGTLIVTASLLGFLMGALILRAVVRRPKAESQNEP